MAWQDHLDTVQKLYVAYYQRPADPVGLKYWAQVIEDFGVDAAVKGFVDSPEAQSLYGGNIEAVITAVYNSAFGRDPEPEGLNYWKGVYEKGWADTGTIVWAIVNGAKGADAIVLENKVESANNFTKVIDPELDGIGPFNATYSGDADAEAGREFLADVDATTVKTESQAESFIYEKIADEGDPIKLQPPTPEGQTFTLTPDIDIIQGTSYNDVFIGDNSSLLMPTVQAGDTLYGSDGTDTVKLYGFTGSKVIIPQLHSVEVVDIVGGAPSSVNIANRAGVEKLVFESAIVTTTVNITVGSNQTVDLVNLLGGSNTIKINSAPSITQNDITVEKVYLATTTIKGTLKISNTKVTTVNIEAKGTGNAFKFDVAKVAGKTVPVTKATVNISGTGAVDILNIAGTKITYDASNNSGGVTVEISATASIPAKFIGGEGTDVVKITDTTTSTYRFNNDKALQNVEKIDLARTKGNKVTVDLSNQSEGFTITGSKVNDTIWGGKGTDTITTGDGSDKVVFTTFNSADKITDFSSAKDDLYLDIGQKGTVNNTLPTKVYVGTNSVNLIITTGAGLGSATLLVNKSTAAANRAKAGTATAIVTPALISKTKFTSLTKTINGIKNVLTSKTGIIFGYTKSAGKLYLFVVKDKDGTGVGKTLAIVNTKTVATLGANTTLTAGDIHIF